MPGDREERLRAGMDAHLSKPIRPEELAAALARDLNSPEWIPPGNPSRCFGLPSISPVTLAHFPLTPLFVHLRHIPFGSPDWLCIRCLLLSRQMAEDYGRYGRYNPEVRAVAADLLRRFRDGKITNDEFESGYLDLYDQSDDRALRAIATVVWCYYSDFHEHTLEYLHPVARALFDRCGLFLRSGFPYEWDFTLSGPRGGDPHAPAS